MSEHDKSDQARKGLIDSVKGRRRSCRRDNRQRLLTAEGQLEQTQARDRMDANSVEAVADAEAEQARVEAAEAREEGAHERAAVNDKTRAAENNVRNDQAAQKRRRSWPRSVTPSGRRCGLNSTHNSTCSRPGTLSAKRSMPRPGGR